MKIEVDPRNIKTGATDNRGRIYLGPEHADKEEVTVVVIEDDEQVLPHSFYQRLSYSVSTPVDSDHREPKTPRINRVRVRLRDAA